MACERVLAGTTLMASLFVALFLYETVGWYFVRGYNEVGNFLVVPVIIALAAFNLLGAAVIHVIRRLRHASGGRLVVASLSLSAFIILLSPLFAPQIGNIAKRNLWIKTPLVEAARYGDASLVIILLQRGADPNARAHGMTPLHYMSARGNTAAVEALLEKGADPNAGANWSLMTPLHWAVRDRAELPTIKALVSHGADPTLKDGDGKTCADYAGSIPDPMRTRMLRVLGN